MRTFLVLAVAAASFVPLHARAQQERPRSEPAETGSPGTPSDEQPDGAAADSTEATRENEAARPVERVPSKAISGITAPVAELLAETEQLMAADRLAAAHKTLRAALGKARAEADRAGRAEAAKRMGALMASTARVRLDATSLPRDAYLLVSVRGELLAPNEWEQTMFLDPGPVAVVVRRPGCGAHRAEVAAERGRTVVVTVPDIDCTADASRWGNSGRARKAYVLFNPQRDSVPGDGTRYLVAAVGGGTVAASAGLVSLVFARAAGESKDKAAALGCSTGNCSRRDGRDAFRAYKSERRIAISAGVVAGLGATVAVVAGVVAHQRRGGGHKGGGGDSSIAIAPTDGGAVVGWTGSF